jgi:hypothetical protein
MFSNPDIARYYGVVIWVKEMKMNYPAAGQTRYQNKVKI